MTIAGLATGATEGFLYIRSEYPRAIAQMRAAIGVMEAAGWLGDSVGGSGRAFRLQVRKGRAPISAARKARCSKASRAAAAPSGQTADPGDLGLFGRPTAVNNVLTLASVPLILDRGAAFYRDFGVGRSHGTRPSSSPATSGMAGWSRRPSASRSAR